MTMVAPGAPSLPGSLRRATDLPAGAAALSDALFAGEMVVYSGIAPFQALIKRARDVVEDVFGEDPQIAEQSLDPATFKRRASRARKQIVDHPQIDRLWVETLEEIGYEARTVRCDKMRLRIAPSNEAMRSRLIRPLPVHRDSWGSGIMCQINWWAPLYRLHETRTMLIWPEGFNQPIANTTEEWDYHTLLSGEIPDYPLLPRARAKPPGKPIPIMIGPGELLAFSAAHLHASATDRSGQTRFSLDTRSIWETDVWAGRGAPNVDSATPPHWDMFGRAAIADPGNEEQTDRNPQGGPR